MTYLGRGFTQLSMDVLVPIFEFWVHEETNLFQTEISRFRELKVKQAKQHY